MFFAIAIIFISIIFGCHKMVYAKEEMTIPTKYSGTYIGKITAVNDFLFEDESTWDWVVELDGIRCNTKFITNSKNKTENEIWCKCRKIGAEDECGSSTVICTFEDGYITQLYSVSDVIDVETNMEQQRGSLYYQNGKFTGERNISLTVNKKIKQESLYTIKDLKEALGEKNIKIVTELRINDNYISFDDGKSEKNIESSMSFIDSKKINFTIIGKGSTAPMKATNFVRINTSCLLERAKVLGDADVSFQIGNLDYQKVQENIKNKNTKIKKQANSAKTCLKNKVAVALDSNLNEYFSTSQINEMEEFLTIWLAEIVESQTFKPENIDDQQLEKVRKKILDKLGISIDSNFLVKNSNADVIITAKSKENKNIKVRFFVNIQSYTLSDSSSPFGSYGDLEYEIINKKMFEDKKVTGNGVVTYANVQTFVSQVKEIADAAIKGAYNEVWGKNANKVAELFISEPVMQLIDGDFSGKVYQLLTDPTENYVKKISIKCPVDVYIYDWDGDCCGTVINNESSSNDLFISVDGDEKNIYLTQEDYIIKLVGNASGNMEYDIDILDGESVIRSIKSENIILEDPCVS